MKHLFKSIIRAVCGWPVIGPPARIAAAQVLLPDWRDSVDLERWRQTEVNAQQAAQQQALSARLTHLERSLAEARGQLEQQRLALETAQLRHTPQALEAAATRDSDSLLTSLPVTLRQLAREQNEARGAMASLTASTDYLLGRVEFVRRELMFEMRYGPAPGGAAPSAGFQVTAPDKLARAREQGVRLNLGCGHLPLPDYLNVDRRPLPGVDLVAEADALPFAADEVLEISSAHLLEHFPQQQLRRQLLPYFYRLLRAGGKLHAVVPDAQAMLRAYADGNYPYADLREVTFGAQDYDGDFHFNMFTPASMTELLAEAGFVDITVQQQGRRNGRCYEFEITARKPAAAGAA